MMIMFLKNMNFVFNEGNLDFFKKQYEQAMQKMEDGMAFVN